DTEASTIGRATGLPEFPGAHGIIRSGILAWQGDEAGLNKLVPEVIKEASEGGQGLSITIEEFAMATLELGYERYEDARRHGQSVFDADALYMCSMELADLVEAASRSNDPEGAHAALAELAVRAEATQTPWGLGVLARSRALMAADKDAEELYREAIEQLAQSGVRTALARAHLLYGEWLLEV